MNWTRRHLIKTSGSASGARLLWPLGLAGCSTAWPLPRLLPSRLQLPQKFQMDLPLLPVLKPLSQDKDADRYELTAQAATVNILPAIKTTIWGYNGSFPGPTIEARRGRKAIVTLRNELPVPIVNHLHGGRTPSDSDGYPTDLVLPKQG